MNGPEIQHLIRRDLQRAVAQRGTPPSPDPIRASPWVAMSVMQKAVRRGREELALRAAATLLRDAPEKLWRRLGCIAHEDVGLASLDAVGLATAALAGKRVREDLGGEWAVASCLVSLLAQAPKCRAADDLLMSGALHPAYAGLRSELEFLSTSDLLDLATGAWPIHHRALALQYAIGTYRRSAGLASRRGEPRSVFDLLCEEGWPHSTVEIAREGYRRTGEMLCPLVALLSRVPPEPVRADSEKLPPEEMIGEIPCWALDLYSREGRDAYARFLQTDAASSQWIRRHVRPARQVGFLGHIVFRVEGGLVANRIRRWLTDELRRQVDFECSGPECPDATEILELVRTDLPRLNAPRAAVMGSRRTPV